MEPSDRCQINHDCGNYSIYKDGNKCVLLNSLNEDLGQKFSADIVITEADLICLRWLGVPLDKSSYICGKHRYKLGKLWKPSPTCKYNAHPKQSNEKPHSITFEMYKFVRKNDDTFVLGSLICKSCKAKINNEMRNIADKDPIHAGEVKNEKIKIITNESRISFHNGHESLKLIQTLLNLESTPSQMKTKVALLSNRQLRHYKQTHVLLMEKFEELLVSSIAPTQEEEYKKLISTTTTPNEPEHELQHLKDCYEACHSYDAKISILTLVPSKFSKKTVIDFFKCSEYEVRKARKVLKENGPCEKLIRSPTNSSSDINKACHFIDFLFSTNLLQEVAFGTTKLKLSNGAVSTISSTILNGVTEHAIREYLKYCENVSYASLKSSSLRDILRGIKPQTRKLLGGVDNFNVEGSEAFEDICLFSSCKVQHTSSCHDCENIIITIDEIEKELAKLPDSHEKKLAQHDLIECKKKIFDWQNHIIRSVQQSKARDAAFKDLDNDECLLIRDYAQKINPMKAVESMSEYFGKRGMSVEVNVFIMKIGDQYVKQTYLVALDHCDQGSMDTISIADVVLDEFHKDFPFVTKMRIKSDNAGAYHANGVAESMYILAKKYGINLSMYDYNEAQNGKDQCDREAAYFKGCLKKYLAKSESNKVSNCEELLTAVFDDGGPRNTKMCIVKIEKENQRMIGVKKIKNISFFHSIKFQDDGALYYEYYQIGDGKFHKFCGINVQCGAVITTNWKKSQINDNIFHQKQTIDTPNVFKCLDPSCAMVFETESQVFNHMTVGHKMTKMDRVKKYFVQQKELLNINNNLNNTSIETEMIESNEFNLHYELGWARKTRNCVRFSFKQKNFILNLFEEGSENKKMTPEEMVKAMKTKKDDEGNLIFEPEEYLTVCQVRGLISGFSSLKKKKIDGPQDVDNLTYLLVN